MAMMYLLLQGDSHVRSHPKLTTVVNKHAEWTQGKNFLLVPYHMIGAETVEIVSSADMSIAFANCTRKPSHRASTAPIR